MDYIGCKDKLNEWIFEHINKHVSNESIFLDACSGSGSVSRYAANLGHKVISCDNLTFPPHLVRGSIGTQNLVSEAEFHINVINELKPKKGFFFKEYSENAKPDQRLYFTTENAKRIDACRSYIEEEIKDDQLKSLLIYCGIEALSRVSNTAGTHGAFLKKFKQRALDKFNLRLEKIIPGETQAFHSDILEFLRSTNLNYDLMYLDPPYTNRQYAPNYHLYETFARYDNPVVKGLTGLRDGWQSESGSDFCKKSIASEFFANVVSAAKCDLVFISYSSDGLLRLRDLAQIFVNDLGLEMEVVDKDFARYKSDKNENREYRKDQLLEFFITLRK